jgi:hypothetical protein
MPFKRRIADQTILEQFEREDLERRLYTAPELAENIDVTADAVRNRLNQLEGDKVESKKLAGAKFWHLKGQRVFVTDDQTQATPAAGENHSRGQTTAGADSFIQLETAPKYSGVRMGLAGALTLLVVTAFAPLLGFSTPTVAFWMLAPLVGFALGYGTAPVVMFGLSLAIGVYQKITGR